MNIMLNFVLSMMKIIGDKHNYCYTKFNLRGFILNTDIITLTQLDLFV